ncbi:P-loop containing nucleoside triphosphate hydrolase protein [Suhomyces tanzawaensis NRRL Y-17324]|uniref:p-loop containing nucleoside triphosphate hydrolase protein n=1 Tax=Suhomyces tanzawaensis NRRL Y-17324 TaxID=984487 RepID=A0A1E4SD78_9ASCO|nr:P-loop containing nucleoside triphosphate hydrolase protein [Suhomyces tanzawaensis NRRL Y-17324]ODV77470.1 P-loop containing nucleoside triphosphate hydrolase protein [Suhomyces tanzawaensis NRRL Y-17324]
MKLTTRLHQHCLVRINGATFSKHTGPNAAALFKNKIEKFEVWKPQNSTLEGKQYTSDSGAFWAITGPLKSTFLSVLAGRLFASPKLARTYPFISKTFQYDRVTFLDFKESSGLDKVHLSARYESYSYKGELEMSDDVNSVLNYIIGSNNYNSNTAKGVEAAYVDRLMELFNLKHLSKKWINSLSNGQLRRARIAKSLILKPNLLIIDDPFLGLDPKATILVLESLRRVSQDLGIAMVLGLRVQDPTPAWVTHAGHVTEDGLVMNGFKEDVYIPQEAATVTEPVPAKLEEISNSSLSPSHIQFTNASVAYRGLKVLDKFNWNIPHGSKWRILGDNGTGKTTILSLITADHPQSWRSVISIEGKPRKTGSGANFFDVNNVIGISSPEMHALVPDNNTAKEIIVNALVRGVGNTNFFYKGEPNETYHELVNKFPIMNTLENTKFKDLSITHQKLVLFLRAVVKEPQLLILDEAFSCMDDPVLMRQCQELVGSLPCTVLAIGHIEWELPNFEYVLKLFGDEERNYKIYKVVLDGR